MSKRWLLAVLVLALAVRLAVFLAATDTRRFWTEDSSTYLKQAHDILWSVKFPEQTWQPPSQLDIFRTPGYPAFVVLGNEAAGMATDHRAIGQDDVELWGTYGSLALQMALDVVLVGLTCALGASLVGPGVGLAAGFLQAISPLAIGSSCRVLSDSLYALVFVASVLFMVAYLRKRRWWSFLGSALALGAASYVRPVGLAMAPAFALAILFRPRARSVDAGAPTSATDVPKPEGLAFISPGRSPGSGGPEHVEPCKGETTHLSRALRASDEQGTGTQGFALGWRMRALQALKTAVGRVACALVFLLLFAACLGPWVMRNGILADYWGFSSAYGDTLFTFACPEILRCHPPKEENFRLARLFWSGDPQVPSEKQWLGHQEYSYQKQFAEENRRPPTLGEMAHWRCRWALETIAAHPWTYAKLHAKGSLAFWLPATDALEIAGLTEGGRGTLGVLREKGLGAAIRNYFGDNWKAVALAIPIALFTLVQYAGAVFCAARGIRRTRFRLPPEVWLLALVVLVSAAMPGVVAHPRFRVPIEPILNVAAAAGIVSLFRRKTARG